jgi:hypothetical protein
VFGFDWVCFCIIDSDDLFRNSLFYSELYSFLAFWKLGSFDDLAFILIEIFLSAQKIFVAAEGGRKKKTEDRSQKTELRRQQA